MVEITKARGLRGADGRGKANPFCSLSLVTLSTGRPLPAPHDKPKRTRVVKGTCAPSWESTKERFVFERVPADAAALPKLRVDVASRAGIDQMHVLFARRVGRACS